MNTILLILAWALSLYAVATFCFHRGWHQGFEQGSANGCIRKYEEPSETPLTEEELFKIYKQKKNDKNVKNDNNNNQKM